MLSSFKDLGQVVQDLCASHSPEGTEAEEDSEEARTMAAQVGKELKTLMEKQGINVSLLSEEIKDLKGTIKELMAEIGNLRSEVQELQQRWNEFIEEEEVARTEYGKYFEEQEKLKQDLRADRDRLLEKELRMEGHLGPATSTSPTRTEIHEFSDRAYFDARTEEEEAQEQMEENENEFYTQSFQYISEEEAGERWQEEGEEEQATGEENLARGEQEKEPERKPGQSQEEYDAERKELLVKARAQIAEKEAKRQEQERGLKTPVDKSHDWKFYTEGSSIWKQNYRTEEKIWWTYDLKYKHQKGSGKQEYEKADQGNLSSRETKRKREEAKAAAEEEERQKQKARETLERAAEENDRKEAAAKKAREEEAAEAEKAAAVAEEKERKKMEAAEAEKRKEQEASKEKETDKSFYAVYPYDGNDYQWKWNSVTCFWYFYDLENRCWHKQEGKDVKGKQVCLSQEQKFLQAKGKKGKGKNKGKEEEENLAKHSPEYDYVEAREGEAGKQEAEGGGSSSTDFQ
ncbi:hypothetical protein AK812_SmicGene29787 [Symbiodinium microadriaticum]|uniref:Reticulocyte-binding protein 2-like a n=1 Tax=Symbiodinium microadriaticum TaxID=2951 RepID=A0A1Q9D0W9_SYMMI|nr:hypothetical protein AK812_SmicGene29787 [Symbiodinium microadriaticum]